MWHTVSLLILFAIVLLSIGLQAEEGMWMPQQIPALAAKLGDARIRRRSQVVRRPGSRVWVTTSVVEAQLEIRDVRLVYAPGEGIGVFDGTYESVSSDCLFDAVKARSIHVDGRYMLWTMAEVDGAKRLLDEMGVSLTAPAPAREPAKAAAPVKAPAVAR
jgi:hypothetical protein